MRAISNRRRQAIRRHRTQLVADGVMASYVHGISERHRLAGRVTAPTTPDRPRPAQSDRASWETALAGAP